MSIWNSKTMRNIKWKLRHMKIYQLFLIVTAIGVASFIVMFLLLVTYLPNHEFINNIATFKNISDQNLRKWMHHHSPAFGTRVDPQYKIVVNPLKAIISDDGRYMQYFDLPKRKHYAQFTEITSANRDTSYPLAPDFTFHIEYGEDNVVLYEDYGPGCIFRIYIFPSLPTDVNTLHKMFAKDLADFYINIIVDDKTFKYTLQQLAEGTEFPFVFPINTQHKHPASGIGTYYPFCYNYHMKMSYVHNEKFPPNVFEVQVNCSKGDEWCPVHIYSGVSRHKYPTSDYSVNSFAHSENSYDFKDKFGQITQLLSEPQNTGPDYYMGCSLKCVEICPGCKVTLYERTSPGVISSIKARAYQTIHNHIYLLEDWTNLYLSANFDGQYSGAINRLPLGWIFGATASLNDFRGAAAGRLKKECKISNDDDKDTGSVPNFDMTGYMYFPMPFWREAELYVEGAKDMSGSVNLCYEITTVPNFYDNRTTGYFHIRTNYFGDDVSGWRNILKLEETWGHIVAYYMNIDNLRAVRNVRLNQRWGLLQSDPVLFVDGSKSATMLGTGLEDYFSYAHGFALAENTTYSFVGVYHSAPKRKEPLAWHCYRQNILDPIPFQNSVHFLMEGVLDNFQEPVKRITMKEYKKRLINKQTTVGHMVIYYAQSTPGLQLSDAIDFSSQESMDAHNFNLISFELKNRPDNQMQEFQVTDVHFLGAVNINETFSTSGKVFYADDKFSFTMKLSRQNTPCILRRTFYAVPKYWNYEADIHINSQYHSTWTIPMGSLNEEYSLVQDDHQISQTLTNVDRLDIEIRPKTDWRDAKYELFQIV